MSNPNPSPTTDIEPGMLLSVRQLRSLASPARNEVFSTLLRLGPASVREVAIALDKPADALYYHFKNLAAAGLVSDCGKRPGATRSESVYEVSARLLRIDPGDRTPRYLGAVRNLFDATLRLLGRRLGAALNDRSVRRAGPGRQLTFKTQLARLDDVALAELNRKLDDLSKFLAERSTPEGGELYQVVTAATLLRRGDD